jgi:hypothetical protein
MTPLSRELLPHYVPRKWLQYFLNIRFEVLEGGMFYLIRYHVKRVKHAVGVKKDNVGIVPLIYTLEYYLISLEEFLTAILIKHWRLRGIS